MPAPTQPTRGPVWPYALLGVVVLAGLIFGAMGLLRNQNKVAEPLTQAKAEAPAPLTRVESRPAAPLTQNTAPAAKVMPEAIRRYLLHVEETEKRRRDLALKHLGIAKVKLTELSAGGTMDALKSILGDEDAPAEPSTREKLAIDMSGMKGEWRDVRDYFRQVPPPAECNVLASRYDQALSEMGAQILDLINILETAGQDPASAISTLEGMKGASETIDKASKEANGQVQEICANYDTKPWFEIASDFGSSGLFKAFGGF